MPVEAGAGYVWLPLSEAGLYTYAHATGLFHGDAWRFVAWDDAVVHEYRANLDETLDPFSVAGHYGQDAQDRVRLDKRTVQLRLRRM